jgi:transglutaminase-like putative cysteine protease
LKLSVDHTTTYTYATPLTHSLQLVRLFARAHAGMAVLNWRVEASRGEVLKSFEDGLGNRAGLAESRGAQAQLRVSGVVETSDTQGWVSDAPEPLAPGYFLRETPLTAPDAALAGLSAAAPLDPYSRAIWLRDAVRDKMEFQVGATDAATPAALAFARGAGVCQDHAHALIAAARACALPARYVSGYLWTGADQEPASHAWAEIYIEGRGWLGLDPANRIWMSPSHVRLTIGLDYAQAAPVTGMRRGGGAETMDVTLAVKAMDQ